MNVFKIAWRSIQYRGLGSFLTILSMALGVMLVVAVLTVYGLVNEFFRNNSSFGYNILVGARGSSMQLVMNSVFYLSRPVETMPYEYYLGFCDQATREKELRHSLAFQSLEQQRMVADYLSQAVTQPLAHGWSAVAHSIANQTLADQQQSLMKLDEEGEFAVYTDLAIPLLLGDSWVDTQSGRGYRVVGTNEKFFEHLILDLDTNQKFQCEAGRFFKDQDSEVGYFGCVVGGAVARQAGLQVGNRLQITHGLPTDSGAHIHEQEFVVVGILTSTGTPHDRALFVNMEGFYLLDDHAKPINDDSVLSQPAAALDPFADEGFDSDADAGKADLATAAAPSIDGGQDAAKTEKTDETKMSSGEITPDPKLINRIRLPMEAREVTAVLVRTSSNDPFGTLGMFLPPQIEQGGLANTLNWSAFRPKRQQTSVQAVNPVQEVTALFANIEPAKWLLLALTVMICVVSGLSIVVGIYNSMNQRHHEIAVMRALGANRSRVMTIMLLESILLAVAGGLAGWIAGHLLNGALSPVIEANSGVKISIFQFAPAEPVFAYWPWNSFLPQNILQLRVSPEVLIIPGLILLAVLVGTYPAVSAYRTDVAKSLGK